MQIQNWKMVNHWNKNICNESQRQAGMHRCVLLNNSKYSLQPINEVRITKQSIIDYRKGKQNKDSEKQEGDLNIKFKIKIKN